MSSQEGVVGGRSKFTSEVNQQPALVCSIKTGGKAKRRSGKLWAPLSR